MTTLKTTAAAVVMMLAFGGAGIALAADGHEHGAKHGGQFVELKGHQGVEMVINGDSIAFYITEDDKPADLTGVSFKVVVQTAAGVKMYPLTVEGSMLKAKLEAALPTGAKVAITGKDGHGHTVQARFVAK